MSLTEKDMILKWCKDNYSLSKTKGILAASSDNDSFYSVRTNDHCMEEYDWSTVPELKEKLDELWENSNELTDIERTVLVAIWKQKKLQNENPNEKQECKELPDYVYVF